MKNKKIWIIILLFCMFLGNFNYAQARTNSSYGTHDVVSDITDEVVKSSVVTEYMSQFIFAIGNVLETVTSWIFGLLTGINSFPWADEVIFNTIGLLDVNFINPSADSIFSNTGVGIGDVIRNIYFTGLSIAIGFLTVIVGVMAIKMAISTIASEKAKYKEAIVTWLTSLVLLFGMHYGISFLFYMNEELVMVGSDILGDTLDKFGDQLAKVMNQTTDEKKSEKVKSALEDAVNQSSQAMASHFFNPFLLGENLGALLVGSSDANVGDMNYGSYEDGLKIVGDEINITAAIWAYLQNHYEITYEVIKNSTVKDDVLSKVHDSSGSGFLNWVGNVANGIGNVAEGFIGKNNALDALVAVYEMSVAIEYPDKATDIDWIKFDLSSAIQSYDSYNKTMDSLASKYNGDSSNYKLAKVVLEYAYKYKNGALGKVSGSDVIANLGQYFKDDTWASGDGWKTTSGSVTSALLYTVFVIQSIGFFISYIRRLFMVTVLAIIAPFVIIYDFFTKSAFGTKSNVFGSWLKELCTLIFVQTFQAFLLAIIMSVIVTLTASEYLKDSNGISAVGILAVFALLSLPKIELLLKNIFGLTSGVADTSLAAGQKSSFAGGLLALKAGKRLLDNPRKVIGGAKNVVAGQLKMRNAKNNSYDKEIANRVGKDGGVLPEAVNKASLTSSGSGSSGGAITKLSDNISELTKELKKGSLNNDAKDKNDKLKALDNAINEAKKQRNEGLKSMLSGTVESIGAVHGAVAGGVIGMARGENAGEAALQGAGVGDAIGEAVSKAISSAPSNIREVKTGIKAELRAHVNEPSRSAYKKLEDELKRESRNTVDEIDKKLYEYTKQSNMSSKNVKISSTKTTPKARNTNADAGNIH